MQSSAIGRVGLGTQKAIDRLRQTDSIVENELEPSTKSSHGDSSEIQAPKIHPDQPTTAIDGINSVYFYVGAFWPGQKAAGQRSYTEPHTETR